MDSYTLPLKPPNRHHYSFTFYFNTPVGSYLVSCTGDKSDRHPPARVVRNPFIPNPRPTPDPFFPTLTLSDLPRTYRNLSPPVPPKTRVTVPVTTRNPASETVTVPLTSLRGVGSTSSAWVGGHGPHPPRPRLVRYSVLHPM